MGKGSFWRQHNCFLMSSAESSGAKNRWWDVCCLLVWNVLLSCSTQQQNQIILDLHSAKLICFFKKLVIFWIINWRGMSCPRTPITQSVAQPLKCTVTSPFQLHSRGKIFYSEQENVCIYQGRFVNQFWILWKLYVT